MLAGFSLAVAVILLITLVWEAGDQQEQPFGHCQAKAYDIALQGTVFGGDQPTLQWQRTGWLVIHLPVTGTSVNAFTVLHLELDRAYAGHSAELLWRVLEPEALNSLKINGLQKVNQFSLGPDSGELTALSLVFSGHAGQSLSVKKATLMSPSCWGYVRALVGHWLSFEPWKHSSINRYSGSRSGKLKFMITPYVALMVALALAAYCLALVLRRQEASFNWSVPAALFFAGWLVLDVLWQSRLLWQLSESWSRYAEKSSDEKLLAGFDAELVRFTREIKQRLPDTPARVLVASSSDYLGMRGAYYLYPHNVYWRRHGPEIPDRQYLMSGDFIVQIAPSDLQFDAASNSLLMAEGAPIEVTPLLLSSTGRLFQVQ